METLSFQAPAPMKKRLEKLSKEMDRSKGYVIREALAEHLDDLEDYLALLREKNKRGKKEAPLTLAQIKRKYRLK